MLPLLNEHLDPESDLAESVEYELILGPLLLVSLQTVFRPPPPPPLRNGFVYLFAAIQGGGGAADHLLLVT